MSEADPLKELEKRLMEAEALIKAGPSHSEFNNLRQMVEGRLDQKADEHFKLLVDQIESKTSKLREDLKRDFQDIMHEELPARVKLLFEQQNDERWQSFRQKFLTATGVIVVALSILSWFVDFGQILQVGG